MKEAKVRRLTLRLPKTLHDQVKRLAAMRRTSISRLTLEGLEAMVREATEAELRAAYDELGADEEQTNVEIFAFAHWEVVNGE